MDQKIYKTRYILYNMMKMSDDVVSNIDRFKFLEQAVEKTLLFGGKHGKYD